MTVSSSLPECEEAVPQEPGSQQDSPERTTAEAASCCSSDMAKIMQECPCASVMKSHCKMALLGAFLVLLAFLISQVGGILGMIAFFRTL